MSADLSTVTVSDVIARRPCGDWAERIPALVAQIRTLRTLILLDLDGYDVLRGELGGVVPPPKGESR